MYGPEERYEDNCIWSQEDFMEDTVKLSVDEINAIKSDIKYDNCR